jgi:hypothetical protein
VLPLLVPVLLAATEVSVTVAPGSECVTQAGLTARLQRAGLTVLPRSERFGVTVSWEGSTVHVRGLRRGASLERDIATSRADCAGLERVIVALIQSWSQSIPKAMGSSREDAGVIANDSAPSTPASNVMGAVPTTSNPGATTASSLTGAERPLRTNVGGGADGASSKSGKAGGSNVDSEEGSIVGSSVGSSTTSVTGGGASVDAGERAITPSSPGSSPEPAATTGSSVGAGRTEKTGPSLIVGSMAPVEPRDAGALVVSGTDRAARPNTGDERRASERRAESAASASSTARGTLALTSGELGASADGGSSVRVAPTAALDVDPSADGGLVGSNPASIATTGSAGSMPRGPTLELAVLGGAALGPTASTAGVGQASAVLSFSRFGAMIDVGLESARAGALSVESTSQWASLSGVIQFEPASRLRLRAGLGLRGFRLTASAPAGVLDARSDVVLSWGGLALGEVAFRVVGPLWAQLSVFGFARWRAEAFRVEGFGRVLELAPLGGGALVGLSIRGVGE